MASSLVAREMAALRTERDVACTELAAARGELAQAVRERDALSLGLQDATDALARAAARLNGLADQLETKWYGPGTGPCQGSWMRGDRRWLHGMDGWRVALYQDGNHPRREGEVTGYSHVTCEIAVVWDGETEPVELQWDEVRPA